MIYKKITEIKANPKNPRVIKDDKFSKLVQSIKDFPEMLADSVDRLIRQNGKEIEYPSGYVMSSYDETHHYEYPPEVIEKFKEGLEILRKAVIYTQRIDWLVSGDDGEESFLSRLKEDLEQLNK